MKNAITEDVYNTTAPNKFDGYLIKIPSFC